jgi:hypothetical protein
MTKNKKTCYKESGRREDIYMVLSFFVFKKHHEERISMSKTEKFQFIRELAVDISRRYKKEGYELTTAQSLIMAREAVEEMEDDFN